LQLYELYLRNGLICDEENRISKGIKGMKQNSYRLLRLINNLIDVTKVDGGFISLYPRNNDIVSTVRKICLSVTEYVTDKDIKFGFNADIKEKTIACDPDKVETIMLNLIANAIKFNKPGGSVIVNINDEGDNILISVEDTGVGIPIERQEAVFKRFMQVDKSLTRNHEGSGIGLSLVKSFVEMHNGQIWLESERGKGSKFSFRLPCRIFGSEETEELSNRGGRIECNDFIERINIEFSDIYME
jgi:signal transduction histidine kinase